MESPIFGILGPLCVRMDGAEIPIAAAKLRVLLAILLLRTPQAVTIDELTDLLWEDRLPRKARAALNTYVGRLRQMLGPLGGRIRTVPVGYVIDLHADELDLARFLELRVTGQAKAAEGSHAAAAKALRSALGLWRGEPLADVASGRLQRDDGYVLTQLRVSVWEACLDAEIADGRAGRPWRPGAAAGGISAARAVSRAAHHGASSHGSARRRARRVPGNAGHLRGGAWR